MENMSSNYRGKDTHGLMTVHLAFQQEKRLRQDGHRLDTEEQPSPMQKQAWNPSVVPRSCARAANFRYRGTQLWRTDDQVGRSRYADGSHRMPQIDESRAGRRSSGQLTVRDVDPTHVSFFTT